MRGIVRVESKPGRGRQWGIHDRETGGRMSVRCVRAILIDTWLTANAVAQRHIVPKLMGERIPFLCLGIVVEGVRIYQHLLAITEE